MARKQ
ncbi:Protein of unknown function [Bacillus mycoides]|jgi:RNA polymerase sigma factor (sigma-70 family)